MISSFHYYIIALLFLLSSCHSSQTIVEAPAFDEELLDTLVVSAPAPKEVYEKLPQYNPSATQKVDLQHMNLDLSFDWEKESVIGLAEIKAKPYFYSIDTLILDASQMDFNKITNGVNQSLNFEYDGKILKIALGKEYTRNDEIVVHIDYIARPTLGRVSGLYNASDQGLYFINSDNYNPEKPMQIWSQGETEYNSAWFPTVDKPNQRFTHDIKLTVMEQFATLSNGYLVSSELTEPGKRTDHWRMDDAHAPYLTMITIGEFSIVKDIWKGKPLLYYVEKEYEAYAKNIFNHTQEMLDYFSELTGVDYPWDQYAQVVIRDFVAGAMENTTAVTFGEFVQKTDRELIDNHNDDIVAHEMFHHWFGDYVTCESWANLTLNEGFANYSEYLWTQHKYGQDEADNKRMNELNGYLYQSRNQGAHPLIHYSYENKENMFDAHSYNKGGLVLHMLRNEIGDEAFFAALNLYLKKNAGSAVEVDELRIAFEDITGMDLKVFFNQWYLSSGHPELEITYSNMDGNLSITVSQIQSGEGIPGIFQIPLVWDIYNKDGSKTRKKAYMNERKQVFDFSNVKEIAWINFDPDHVLLGEWSENRSTEEYVLELFDSSSQYDKREALNNLQNEEVDHKIYERVILSNQNYINKFISVSRINYSSDRKDFYLQALALAKNTQYKSKLLSLFLNSPEDIGEDVILDILEKDKAWNVISPALLLLSYKNMTKAKTYMDEYRAYNNTDIIFTLSSIFAGEGMFSEIDYMISKIKHIDSRYINNYSNFIIALLERAGENERTEIFEKLDKFYENENLTDPDKKRNIKQIIGEWRKENKE